MSNKDTAVLLSNCPWLANATDYQEQTTYRVAKFPTTHVLCIYGRTVLP